METEQSIVRHAQAKGATLEEAAQASLLLRLQVIPLGSVCSRESPGVPNVISAYYNGCESKHDSGLLRFRGILSSVHPRVVVAVMRIKRENMDRGRAEHHEVPIVRVQPLEYDLK